MLKDCLQPLHLKLTPGKTFPATILWICLFVSRITCPLRHLGTAWEPASLCLGMLCWLANCNFSSIIFLVRASFSASFFANSSSFYLSLAFRMLMQLWSSILLVTSLPSQTLQIYITFRQSFIKCDRILSRPFIFSGWPHFRKQIRLGGLHCLECSAVSLYLNYFLHLEQLKSDSRRTLSTN